MNSVIEELPAEELASGQSRKHYSGYALITDEYLFGIDTKVFVTDLKKVSTLAILNSYTPGKPWRSFIDKENVKAPYGLPKTIAGLNASFTIHGDTYQSAELEDLVMKARAMTTFPEDWDDDGALPISEESFNIAISFLRDYLKGIKLKSIKEDSRVKIQLPEINPCKDGSIDIEWHLANIQALINVRKGPDGEYLAYYYGDRYNNTTPVKGNTSVKEFPEHLAAWMMKYL